MFLLDSQVNDSSPAEHDTQEPVNDEDDQRSYVFVLASVENKEKPENAERCVKSELVPRKKTYLQKRLMLLPLYLFKYRPIGPRF